MKFSWFRIRGSLSRDKTTSIFHVASCAFLLQTASATRKEYPFRVHQIAYCSCCSNMWRGLVPASCTLNISPSVCQPYCLCAHALIWLIIFLGKLIQTNSGAREHLFYEAPSGNRKTISVPDVERLQWSTFTCVLGPTVKGVFPPGSDVTDVNATCCSRDGSLLASGDDFGLVKLFEYPVSVRFSNLRKTPNSSASSYPASFPC